MSTLTEAINASRTGLVPIDRPALNGNNIRLGNDLQPGLNPMTRCPLPPISASPDSLRTFYSGGVIPQHRVIPPSLPAQVGGGGSVIENVTTESSGSGSTVVVPIKAIQASITTPTLNPNGVFTGVLTISRSFQLLQITASSPARIELYGTATAQNTDLGRALDVPPGAGTFQNIISDVALDTPTYQWPYQNRIGANGDSPQQPLLYITVTNLDVTSDAITVTLLYVPLES